MTALVVQGFDRQLPIEAWKWRDRKGNMWLPGDMETRHLFYTVRMIWNHAVDPDMRVGENIILYNFPDVYTVQYVRTAVAILGKELLTRDDMEEWMKREFMHMANHFYKQGWMEQGQIGFTASLEYRP
jgi:hypothetical protein